jgi:hypothetical protein
LNGLEAQLIDSVFATPHDNQPKWCAMLTAYLDESGLDKRGVVRVGGFIGNDDQWKKLASEWPKAFEGRQRKSLHTKTLKFKYDSEKSLLEKLGPIPHSCGLRRIMGSVDESDYYDLVKGTTSEAHSYGYALAMWPLIEAIEGAIPTSESYKLVFEPQDALGFYRDKWLTIIAYILSHPPPDRRHIKRPKLLGSESLLAESCLCEPADYLCYHLAHKADDPKSIRALWTAPIMEGDSIWRRHLSRDMARWFFRNEVKLDRLNPDDLAAWKRRVRSGAWDPWKAALEKHEQRSIITP